MCIFLTFKPYIIVTKECFLRVLMFRTSLSQALSFGDTTFFFVSPCIHAQFSNWRTWKITWCQTLTVYVIAPSLNIFFIAFSFRVKSLWRLHPLPWVYPLANQHLVSVDQTFAKKEEAACFTHHCNCLDGNRTKAWGRSQCAEITL